MIFLKSIKNHFPPGPAPRNAIFPKIRAKKNPKIFKKSQKSPHSYPPWGALLYGLMFIFVVMLIFVEIVCV